MPRDRPHERLPLGAMVLWFCTTLGLGSCAPLESRFYGPEARHYPAPEGVEEWMLESEDGGHLQTWFVPAPSLREGRVERAPLVLFCPGSRTQIDELAPMLRPTMGRADVSLLLLNYRGYGRSTPLGSTTRRSTLRDVRLAFERAQAREDVDPNHMALMGYSLGGVPALALAAENPEVSSIVVGGTYASTSDVLADMGRGSWAWLIGASLDPEDSAAELADRAVLLFHGEEDRDVPPYHAMKLGAAMLRAGARLEFVLVPDAGHFDVLTPGSALDDQLVDFLGRTLHGESTGASAEGHTGPEGGRRDATP